MYLLDANVFIEAKRRHYGLDFCPAFWDWIDQANARGRVFSIDKVADELAAGADDLSTWAHARPGLFLAPDASFLASFQVTSQWATAHPTYQLVAKASFLQDADAYLVAHAHATRYTVVTHETASPSTKEIKVPDACDGLNVLHLNPFAMLRMEGARFVLGA
jgi:hypothetical protein